MSDTFVVEPLPVPAQDKRPARRTARMGLGTRFAALIEALVDASSHRFEGAESAFYRFPPF